MGEGEVARVAGHAVELDEPHLGDLVAGPDALLAGPEGAVEQVRGLEGHVEERPLAGRLVVGDGGLVEVAEVVELVAVLLLELPALLARPVVRALGVDGARGVEVAVRLLGGRDLRDERVEVGLELRVGLHAQGVGRPLDHLVDVGVVEGIAGGGLVLERLAAEGGRGALEVVDALRLLALLEGERDGHRAVHLDPRQPEAVGEVHGGEGHGLHRVVAGGPGRAEEEGGGEGGEGVGGCFGAGHGGDGITRGDRREVSARRPPAPVSAYNRSWKRSRDERPARVQGEHRTVPSRCP